MMNQANYPAPDLSSIRGSEEETSIRTSSTAQDDAPPPPILEPECEQSDWVEYLQGLLNQFGANPQLEVDGKFGSKTTAAVRQFKQANGLDGSATVDVHVWRALGAYAR
jgi:peptidoglycan hydrolase-like protein with peptidoglycan-binding domain